MHQGSHAFVVLCFVDRGATSDGVDVIFVFFCRSGQHDHTPCFLIVDIFDDATGPGRREREIKSRPE
jgi:hypothetical protein